MKKLIPLFLILLVCSISKAQTSWTSTFNFTINKYATTEANNAYSVPRGVGFGVVGSQLVLNDTALASYTDSLRFEYSSIVNDSLYIQKKSIDASNGSYTNWSTACHNSIAFSANPFLDSTIIQFPIAPISSFNTLHINYQGRWYHITKPTPTSISYLKWDEADVKLIAENWSSFPCSTVPLLSQDNGKLLLSFNFLKGQGSTEFIDASERKNDSIYLHMYSTNCLGHLANTSECVQVYLADWNSFTALDVHLHSDLVTDDWVHIQKDSNGFLTWNPISPAYDYQSFVGIEQLELSLLQQQNKNVLNWKVSDEKSISYFEIMFGENPFDYSIIQSIKTTNNKLDYSYTDETPKDAGYYKIRAYSQNGQYTESNTTSYQKTTNNSITISPNPTSDFINITGLENSFNLKITTITGKEMLRQKIELDDQIDLSEFPAGVYLTQLQNLETGEIFTQKIVKE